MTDDYSSLPPRARKYAHITQHAGIIFDDVLQDKSFVVHQNNRNNISSSYDTVATGVNIETNEVLNIDVDGLNFKPSTLKAIDATKYDDMATRKTEKKETETSMEEGTKAFDKIRQIFFPYTDTIKLKGEIVNEDQSDKYNKHENYNMIDIDNIFPVSPQGFSTFSSRNFTFDSDQKNYTSVYLMLYEILFMDGSFLPELMSASTYLRHAKSSYKDGYYDPKTEKMKTVNREENMTLEDIIENVNDYKLAEKSNRSVASKYAKALSKMVKMNCVLDMFTMKKYRGNKEKEEGKENEKMDNKNLQMTVNSYMNNVKHFLVHHLISSSQQRALLFEKDFGVRPFYNLGNYREVAIKRVGRLYPFIVSENSPPSYDIDNQDFSFRATISNKYKEATTTSHKERKREYFGKANRLWSSYISNVFLPKLPSADKQYSVEFMTEHLESKWRNEESFLHLFQYKIDKVYGYCKVLSEKDWSLVYDSSVNNTATLEPYMGKFYQYCLSMTSSINSSENFSGDSVKFSFVLKSSVYTSDLAYHLNSTTYRNLALYHGFKLGIDKSEFDVYLPESRERSVNPEKVKAEDDKYRDIFYNLTNKVVYISSTDSVGKQDTVIDVSMSRPIELISSVNEMTPLLHILKRAHQDDNMKIELNSLEDFEQIELRHRFGEDVIDMDPNALLRFYQFILYYSISSFSNIYKIIDKSLSKMQINNFKISSEIIALPISVTTIKSPLSHKIERCSKNQLMEKVEYVNMQSGINTCGSVIEKLIFTKETDSSTKSNSPKLLNTHLFDPSLNHVRSLPPISQKSVSTISLETIFYLTDIPQSEWILTKFYKEGDLRKRITSVAHIKMKDNLFLAQNLIELSEDELEDAVSSELIIAISDDKLDATINLEVCSKKAIDIKSKEEFADLVIFIKSLPSSEIARMANVTQMLLMPDNSEDNPNNQDKETMDDELDSYELITDKTGKDALYQYISNMVTQSNISGMKDKDDPDMDYYKTFMTMDTILRLHHLRNIYGRRMCKIIQIWKRPLKEFNLMLSLWSTLVNKDYGPETKSIRLLNRRNSLCDPNTFMENVHFTLTKSYKESLFVSEGRTSLLTNMLENFEDPIYNNSVFQTYTGIAKDDTGSVERSVERFNEKLKQTEQLIQKTREERKKANANILVKLKSMLSKWYSKDTTRAADALKSTNPQFKTSDTIALFNTENIGKYSLISVPVEFDDMDMLVDTSTVCGFFKNCVLLDHGYSNNEEVNYELCQNEAESVNYIVALWTELTSSNASSSIISPHKGYIDRFYNEFRNPQDSVNNVLYNTRIITNQWRVDVPDSTKKVIKKRSKVEIDTTYHSIRLSEWLDILDKGPPISQSDYIFSKIEIELTKGLKWLKINGLGEYTDPLFRTALLLDINSKYINPYDTPINRNVGSGLPRFIVEEKKMYDKYEHPAIANRYMEIASSILNDGLELSQVRTSLYMNPFFSFRSGGLQSSIQDTTIFNARGVDTQEEKLSEREPIELIGCVLMSRSLLHGNCIWLDANKEYSDISKQLDPKDSDDMKWFKSKIFQDHGNDLLKTVSDNETNSSHNKSWDTKNYSMYPDLVPTDVLCAISANRIHLRHISMNATTRGRNIVEEYLSPFDSSPQTEVKSMNEFIKEKYYLYRYIIDTMTLDSQQKQEDEQGGNNDSSALQMSSNFMSQRFNEYYLRKTYFDVACSNLMPLIRYGSMKRPFTSKRVWDVITERSGKFGAWKLSENMDANIRDFIQDFHTQPIASPQLYLLQGRKMAPLSHSTFKSPNAITKKIIRPDEYVDIFMSYSVSSYIPQSIPSTLYKNYMDATKSDNQKSSSGNIGIDISSINRTTAGTISIDHLDMRYLIDVSFLRRSKKYLTSLEDTNTSFLYYKNTRSGQKNFENDTDSLLSDVELNRISYPTVLQRIKSRYIDKLSTLSHDKTNVPNNYSNGDNIPALHQVLHNPRNVSIPIYSLDSVESCPLIVPPMYQYTNSSDISSGIENGRFKDDEEGLHKIESIYKNLSWISDTEKVDNVGTSIVGMMSLVSSLWVVCMTAKVEALEIYRPQDILKMTTGKWIIPHNADPNTGTVSGMICANKFIYDFYEKEFTGISDVVIGEISNAYTSNGSSSGRSSIHLKTTNPGLSTEGLAQMQEAFEYVYAMPDMYRKHVGHIMHAYEKESILNVSDPIKARENELKRFDVLNSSHSQSNDNMIDGYRYFLEEMSKDTSGNLGALHDISENRLRSINNFAHYSEINSARQEELNMAKLLTRQEGAVATRLVPSSEEKDPYSVSGGYNKEKGYKDIYHLGDDKVDQLMAPLNPRRYIEIPYELGEREDKTSYPISRKDYSTEDRMKDQNTENDLVQKIENYKKRMQRKEIDEILRNAEGFSVASILYSSLSKSSHVSKHSVLSPLQRDSFNVMYTLIKMMESGSTKVSRLLDTGSGLSSQLLFSNDRDSSIKALLDASIEMKGLDLWNTLPSAIFEIGPLDSLISDQ